MVALDTSVILDVVTDDPDWADASERAISKALSQGALIIGECVLAEVVPAIGSGSIADFLADWKIQFVPSTRSSAEAAGAMYRKYLERGGGARRVLADFLIGSHAAAHASFLIARDRGYYRDYFRGLRLIDPSQA